MKFKAQLCSRDKTSNSTNQGKPHPEASPKPLYKRKFIPMVHRTKANGKATNLKAKEPTSMLMAINIVINGNKENVMEKCDDIRHWLVL